MKPSGPGGVSHIVVAVCAFTKWVELGALLHTDAGTIRNWFHENILCRYGLPSIVCTDGGAAFKGEFRPYLWESGIR